MGDHTSGPSPRHPCLPWRLRSIVTSHLSGTVGHSSQTFVVRSPTPTLTRILKPRENLFTVFKGKPGVLSVFPRSDFGIQVRSSVSQSTKDPPKRTYPGVHSVQAESDLLAGCPRRASTKVRQSGPSTSGENRKSQIRLRLRRNLFFIPFFTYRLVWPLPPVVRRTLRAPRRRPARQTHFGGKQGCHSRTQREGRGPT